MNVGDYTTVTTAYVPPVIPAANQPVRPAADGSSAARDRRDGNNAAGRGANFRAALDAAISADPSQDAPQPATSQSASTTTAAVRPEKRPSASVELDAKESAALYRAAQHRAASTDKAESSNESSASDEGADPVPVRRYFDASRQYAQRFFSVGGTFAARGESLELRA
jgi:hypothetical protein